MNPVEDILVRSYPYLGPAAGALLCALAIWLQVERRASERRAPEEPRMVCPFTAAERDLIRDGKSSTERLERDVEQLARSTEELGRSQVEIVHGMERIAHVIERVEYRLGDGTRKG